MSKNSVEHEVQVYPGVPHGKLRPTALLIWA
jgi:hypothetical protein